MTEKEKLSVLIVDDDSVTIDLISRSLGDRYGIFTANNGAKALKIAYEARPDLILLDVLMPDMDGFKVLNQLKKSELTKDIPVIFITGQNDRDEEVRGLTLGAVDYIAKPVHSLVVEARVNTHMRSLEQMRLIKRMSTTDELTGLPNRRYFNDQVNKEWSRAVRETSWLSLLIIDIDRFKQYNDTHGYPQGDVLLKAVADVLRRAIKRTSDVAARWGGEQFAMILPRTDIEGAADVAERIRTNVERMVIPCVGGAPTNTTISIGLNAEQPIVNDLTSINFVTKADKALHQAKKDGRNRVCVYQADF
jgi:diguanylate cyclase (GGDEF)-like protein